ncbi:hypothetical protein Tco_0502272 [Tanacetum coccineum]
MEGVRCNQVAIGRSSVGLYVPGGPLKFNTAAIQAAEMRAMVDGKIVGPEIPGSWNHGSVNGLNSQSYEGTWRSISLKPLARLEMKVEEMSLLLVLYSHYLTVRIGQDGDHTMTSSNTSNIKELDGSFAVPTQPKNSLRHDIHTYLLYYQSHKNLIFCIHCTPRISSDQDGDHLMRPHLYV